MLNVRMFLIVKLYRPLVFVLKIRVKNLWGLWYGNVTEMLNRHEDIHYL